MTSGLVSAIEQYLQTRTKKKELEEKLKQTNKELESLETTIIASMSSLNLTSLKLASGELIGIRHRNLYDPPPKNSPEYLLAMKWLKENGAESIVTEQVNWQSLNSFLSDYIEHGNEEPPEHLFHKRPELKLFVNQ